MATKKQKHAAALAKREAFLAEEKQRGLEAQEWSRKRQEERRQVAAAAAMEIDEHFKDILRHATPDTGYGVIDEEMGSENSHSNLMMDSSDQEDLDKVRQALRFGY